MADVRTWVPLVAAWRASGETAAAFSSGRGFAPSTLRWWASRLGRREAGFVRVVATPEPPRPSAIELDVGGIRVLVRAGFDRTALTEVLEVLGASASCLRPGKRAGCRAFR